MWEGDNLNVAPLADFIAQLRNCFESGKRGIGDIYVSADETNAVFCCPTSCLESFRFNVFFDVEALGLAVGPDFDGFKKCAGRVFARDSSGVCVVKVDVCFGELGRDQSSCGIVIIGAVIFF